MPAGQVLRLKGHSRSRHQLVFDFELDPLQFRTSYWYDSVDLPALEARFGAERMRNIYFHIGAFELNKVASLRPELVDFGPFADLVTPQFETLWRTIFRNVWAQWRFENDLPSYYGPDFASSGRIGSAAEPIPIEPGEVEILAFCGGGKDSLVAMDLLERAGLSFATLAYSSSIYGRAETQHELIDRLADHFSPRARHRQWIYDDFIDSPILDLEPPMGIHTVTAAETPASIFASLPIALAHGYTRLCLAHEKSADVGNLFWQDAAEEVNHQWGKSTEAEALLDDYLSAAVVPNLRYFSILKPLHDVVIFEALLSRLEAVPSTHSCNVSKPWCGKCAKCAYVYLNYAAYLPWDVVNDVFHANFFDARENYGHFRELLGLAQHTPFECVGQVEESRLAMTICELRNIPGQAVVEFAHDARLSDPMGVADAFTSVDETYERMPADVWSAVRPLLHEHALNAKKHVEDYLLAAARE